MTDIPKMDRLLHLLTLLCGPFAYTLDDLASRVQKSPRTILRYIQSIEDAGFIIHKSNGFYKLMKENKEGKMLYELLHFTREEAFVLGKAIYSIDANNLIKSTILKKLYALYDFEKAAETFVNPVYGENVHKLLDAINHKKQVILKGYSSAHSHSISDRLVEAFDFTSDFISIWCYEIKTQKVKLFKTSRIREVEILDKPWQYQDQHQKGYIDIFRVSSAEKYPVKLELSIRAYNLLIEEYPQAHDFISKNDENKYLFDGWVCSWEGIGRFCLGLIDEIKIISPEELKIHIKNKIKNPV